LSARYLLRFDDLCPTMDRERWERFERLIVRFRLKPILAVVPDNRDPELVLEAADPGFWERMRRLEAEGATIGLHGLTHLCEAHGRSLIPLHRRTEFAGVAKQTQREWIRAGLAILEGYGLKPRIWVAPRHGFDVLTLEALREEGVELISDGFARRPFRMGGLVWVPQQLWGPVVKANGVWTICLHANSASEEDVRRLETFLESHAEEFVSVDEAVRSGVQSGPKMADRIFHGWVLARIGLSRWRKRFGLKKK
jgi:hypothetical protein